MRLNQRLSPIKVFDTIPARGLCYSTGNIGSNTCILPQDAMWARLCASALCITLLFNYFQQICFHKLWSFLRTQHVFDGQQRIRELPIILLTCTSLTLSDYCINVCYFILIPLNTNIYRGVLNDVSTNQNLSYEQWWKIFL